MSKNTSLEAQSLDQIRKAAVEKQIHGASSLPKRELVRILRMLVDYEEMSKTKLLSLLQEYRIKGINQLTRHQLELIAIQAWRLEDLNLDDLRSVAKKEGLVDTPKLRKKDIVNQLLIEYLDNISSEPIQEEAHPKTERRPRQFARIPWKKYLGRAIQTTSVISVALSLLCLILIPVLGIDLSKRADAGLHTISRKTDEASKSLRQVSLALDEGAKALDAAVSSLHNIEVSIKATKPLIGSTSELLTVHAPTIIEDTGTALISAEESARAVDQVLRNLARLGPLTGVTYNPAQPLNKGISEVTRSLEPLPDAMRKVGNDLTNVSTSLDDVGVSLSKVGTALGGFSQQITDSKSILASMSNDLDNLSNTVDESRENIGSIILVVASALELIFITYALGRIALFYVGRDLAQNVYYLTKVDK